MRTPSLLASAAFLGLVLGQLGCPQFNESTDPPPKTNNTSNNTNNKPQPDMQVPQEDAGKDQDTPQPDMRPRPDMAAPDQGVEDMPKDMPASPRELRACKSVVRFDGAVSAGKVTISGEFNAWDIEATPLQKQADGWSTELELMPGHYAYKFVIDGQYEGALPPEVPTKWSGDVENRNLIVPDCKVPMWRVVSKEIGADGTIKVALRFVSASTGEAIDPASVRATIGDVQLTPTTDPETGLVSVTYKAPSFGKYSLNIWAKDTAGDSAEQDPLWLPMWYEQEPFTWQDATMYLIFTDRFLDTDNGSPVPQIPNVQPIAGYMGGDFRGIIQKIEEGYFDELGVNLLWLSPIYENTEEAWVGGDGVNMFTGYHGYWPIDPLNAETRYGDAQADANARLKELIDKAHARGIRVLFDVVHNHVHEDHVWCQQNPSWCQITCNCGSQGCAWEGPEGKPLTCQFAPYLPDLSYRNHDILRRQIDDTVELGRRFDIDGFRVDAAKHMDHIIMRRLRQRLEVLEDYGAAEFYTVGETYTGGDGYGLIMDYVADHELHGQFDFPLLYPIRGTFGRGESFRGLEAAVVRSEQSYGRFYPWMSPFLGNHDIPRFVTEALGNGQSPFGGTPDVMAEGPAATIVEAQWNVINRMSMAFAFLLTQGGVPLIYYGDEIGLAGAADPDNRRMMLWQWNAGQRELLERVKKLGQARQALTPLRRGQRKELWVDDDLYVYARYMPQGDAVIVAMNKGFGPRSEQVTFPAELGLNNKTLVSYNSTRQLVVGATTAPVTLDPWEYAIFYVAP